LIGHTTPLEGHPAFRASRYRELEQAVCAQLSASFVSLPEQRRVIDARANRFDLPHSSLWFCAYGIPVAIKFPEADHFRIQFHHAGTGATWIGDGLVPVTGTQACISSGHAEFDFAADFQQVVWRIPKTFVIQKLTDMIGAPLTGGLDFDRTLNLTGPQSKVLMHLLACVIQTAESMRGEPAKIVLAELEQALVSAFLASSRHAYRDQLERKAPGAAPWQVRRAEGYIAANWDKPVTIELLAEITGTSARSIFRAFQKSRGYTPLEFAKRIRLEQARRMLLDPEAAISVTEVAFACGFGDLSRFSKDYGQAFGERPSAVLNRKKEAAAA